MERQKGSTLQGKYSYVPPEQRQKHHLSDEQAIELNNRAEAAANPEARQQERRRLRQEAEAKALRMWGTKRRWREVEPYVNGLIAEAQARGEATIRLPVHHSQRAKKDA